MATVMGGVSFGLYVTAKVSISGYKIKVIEALKVRQRYILPLIKPPTPAQLTQDKESIDTAFSKAFSAIEQIESDTKALKEAEETRTSRLDSALTELEAVVAALKDSDAAFRAYIAAYPSGLYAASAQGLLRRVAWLGGAPKRLAGDYAWAFVHAGPSDFCHVFAGHDVRGVGRARHQRINAQAEKLAR